MGEMTLTRDEERALRHALMDLPKVCRYHGSDFEQSGMWRGLPNCESCRIPFRARAAWQAFTAAVDRRESADEVAPSARTLFGLKLPEHIHTGRVCDEGKLWCAKHEPQLSSEWTSGLDELRAFLRDHAHPTDAEVDRCHESTDFAHTCRLCQAPPVERQPDTTEEAGRG